MIEKFAKVGELASTVKDASFPSKFDPDKRIEVGSKRNVIEKAKSFNPDLRISEFRPFRDKHYTTEEERIKCTNLDKAEGGLRCRWQGERGNSLCMPTYRFIKNELAKYGIDGIEFKKGVADFSPVAQETVKIKNMGTERLGKGGNFEQANNELAQKFNKEQKDGKKDWTARDVENYRIEHKLTWHEDCDCKTMQLVPTKIHEYFHHSGGVAECKARDAVRGKFDGK